MKTPAISDQQVCEACRDYNANRTGSAIDLLLLVRTNTDVESVNTAIARCVNRGLIEFDTTARTGWLTTAGLELIGETVPETETAIQEKVDTEDDITAAS